MLPTDTEKRDTGPKATPEVQRLRLCLFLRTVSGSLPPPVSAGPPLRYLSWWPHGEWEDFYAASFFCLWIFVCDDTIDANDHDLSENFQKACRFRRNTLAYCKYHLGLAEGTEEPELPSLACALFKEFAKRIVEKFQKRMWRGCITHVG